MMHGMENVKFIFCFYNVVLMAQITKRPITGLFVGRLINGEVWKGAVLT